MRSTKAFRIPNDNTHPRLVYLINFNYNIWWETGINIYKHLIKTVNNTVAVAASSPKLLPSFIIIFLIDERGAQMLITIESKFGIKDGTREISRSSTSFPNLATIIETSDVSQPSKLYGGCGLSNAKQELSRRETTTSSFASHNAIGSRRFRGVS